MPDEPSDDRTRDEPSKLTREALEQALAQGGAVFLDVRTASEIRELGTLEGHVHIPLDELADRLDALPRDQPIVTA